MNDRKNRDHSSNSDNEEQKERDPGTVVRNPRIIGEQRAPRVKTRPERTVAISKCVARVVIDGVVIVDKRRCVLVALPWRRGGSAPKRTWVPELGHRSFWTVRQLPVGVRCPEWWFRVYTQEKKLLLRSPPRESRSCCLKQWWHVKLRLRIRVITVSH